MNIISAGGFDSLYTSRKAVYDIADQVYDRLRAARKCPARGSLDNFVEIEDKIEPMIWDNSYSDWDPLDKFTRQLAVLGLPGGYTILDEQFYQKLPGKIIKDLKTINEVKSLMPDKCKVIGWLKIITKFKNNVRLCALSDEFGRVLEAVAYEKQKAIEDLPAYTLIILHLKSNEYKGRTGYVIEKYEPILN